LITVKGNKTSDAKSILNVPTCAAEKMGDCSSVNIPFFINMKELPQMQDNKINSNQLFVVFVILVKLAQFFNEIETNLLGRNLKN
jgi:hypothetical protein